MEIIKRNGKEYVFVRNYKENDTLRRSFNALTRRVYQFDFEPWYQSGYWSGNCMLYSLLHKDVVVSHITVTVLDVLVMGASKRFVQLGTVMTEQAHRGQGLSRFLMEKVLAEWETACDLIYLFANDSVLEFYPKFGFAPAMQYCAAVKVKKTGRTYSMRRLDMGTARDRALLFDTAQNSGAFSALSVQNNGGLVLFYCHAFELLSFRGDLVFIEEWKAIAVAAHEGGVLHLYDVFAAEPVAVGGVLDALAMEDGQRAVLHFMPLEQEGYEIRLFEEEDSTLFVKGKASALFWEHRLLFPILSHT